MFGTSNFGTAVTLAPSCGLRHHVKGLRVPKLMTWAEVNKIFQNLSRSSPVPKFVYPGNCYYGKQKGENHDERHDDPDSSSIRALSVIRIRNFNVDSFWFSFSLTIRPTES